MPKPKITNNQDDNNEIKVNIENKSSIAEFIKRPIPSDKELENFEDYTEEGAREEEIEESLSEIYKEVNGDMADVKKMDIKKKHGFLFWFFTIVFTLFCLAGAGYGAYYFYMQSGSDSKAVELAIEGKNEVMAGEEFFYTVNFKNLENLRQA